MCLYNFDYNNNNPSAPFVGWMCNIILRSHVHGSLWRVFHQFRIAILATAKQDQDNGFGVPGRGEFDTQPPCPSIKTHLELRWNRDWTKVLEWQLLARNYLHTAYRKRKRWAEWKVWLPVPVRKCGVDIFGRCQWKGGGVLGIWQTIGKLNDGEHSSGVADTDRAWKSAQRKIKESFFCSVMHVISILLTF